MLPLKKRHRLRNEFRWLVSGMNWNQSRDRLIFGECVFLTAICPLKGSYSVSPTLCCSCVVHSWGLAYVFMCTWKPVFQHSCVLFSLLSQTDFNPFHIIILLILVPKCYHLEQKSALSPTNTIQFTTGSCPLLSESHHYKWALICICVILELWGHFSESSQCCNEEQQQ